MAALSRRRFLRGEFSSTGKEFHPPWALGATAFASACSRCEACIAACSASILIRGAGGYPTVDFVRGACTFCGQCVSACRDGALRRDEGALPWALRAVFGDTCLSVRGVVCRVCGDICEATAIRFRPRAGGVSEPQLDVASCSGCGACVSGCPVDAISMECPEPAMAA